MDIGKGSISTRLPNKAYRDNYATMQWDSQVNNRVEAIRVMCGETMREDCDRLAESFKGGLKATDEMFQKPYIERITDWTEPYRDWCGTQYSMVEVD